VIRPAVEADAEAIEPLIRRAWARAYGDFIDVAAALDEPEQRVLRWRERLRSGVVRTLVFDLAGRIVGLISFGASDDTDTPLDHAAVRALYVDPPAQGAGVGTLLLDAAFEHLHGDGFRGVELWVFERNEHARAFYERRGFQAAGEGIDPGTGAPELRYRRSL
jgi:GNAT superfamily N-acetyltransferase